MSYGTTTMACSGLQFGCTYPPSINNSLTTSPQLLLSGTNLTQAAAAAAAVAAVTSSSSSSSTCCENGRPIVTDPCTGQSTCTCQIHPAILASYPRVPSLMDHLYNTAGLSPTSLLGAEPSAFYAPLKPSHTGGYDLERSAEAWKGLAAASVPSTCYTYDPAALAAHSYNNLYQNLDYNNATRRKNATRETTNALKAWLYEHRKNPYPTKGEKIMLAIITKMTLTQVSTWFANARRRLKKENKMTWTSKEKDDDMMQDKDDVLSHEPEDDLVNSRDENAREDTSSSYDEDERLDVSGFDEKDEDFSKCLPTAADMADSDVENERPPGADIIKSSSPPPLQPPPLTINHSMPKAPAVSHSFYRYSSIIPRSSRCNFGISSDKQHPPKLIETELNTNGHKDNINGNHEGFSPIPSDGGTKGSCSPAERTKSQPEVERSPSKTQGSVTVAVKPKIWSISNIMDSSSSSSSSSSVSSSSLSSGAPNSCHPTLNGPHHKISGRLQIPSDHHLVANRPSILHYDSAMSRERMCALQIYLPSHELLPNAFNHSPAHADLASFRNLCVAGNSNHPLETPPHTPPERQTGGSHFDVNCPQLSAPPIEVTSTMATAPSANSLPLQAKLPPTQPSQSRDINGLALIKSFNKIPK